MWSVFSFAFGHLNVFLGNMSVQLLSPFLSCVIWFLMLSCTSSFYILDANP